MMPIETNSCLLRRLIHDCGLIYVCVLFGSAINRNRVIFRLKESLKEMIDPDFGLPDILMGRRVLTDDDRQTVESKASLQQRNDELLDLVLQHGDSADLAFIDCLVETDQRHVYNYVVCNGGNHCAV